MLFVSFGLQAQFGARLGVNLANNKVSVLGVSASGSNLIGIHAGVTYTHPINETISLRPGLLYSMKGTKATDDSGGTDVESKQRINYLEIPIDVVYDAGSLNLFAGPYLGYGLNASVSQGDESMDVDFDEGGFKRLDFGLNLGIAYEVNEQISIGAQYGLGLANLDDTEDTFLGEITVKNKVIAFFAGYAF